MATSACTAGHAQEFTIARVNCTNFISSLITKNPAWLQAGFKNDYLKIRTFPTVPSALSPVTRNLSPS